MGDLSQAASRTAVTPAAPTGTNGPTPADPLELVQRRDAGSLARATLSLQRAAGNRAVAASLAQIGRVHATSRGALATVGTPASTAAPAPGGVIQIATSATGMRAAGVTSLPAPGAPDVVIGAPTRQTDGRWQASVNSTQVTPDAPTSLFPGAGLHNETPTETGMQRHRHVTPAASDEIRRGEEEHLLDLEWARHLAYDQVADAVNRVAGSAPANGANAEEARQIATYNVRSAVPDKARWPDGTDPITHWRRLYGRLVAVTRERDSNRWHNMNTEIVMDAAAKRRLGVPVADELLSYIAGSTQVGQHPSEALVDARYQAQTTEPMGQPPAGMFSQPAPKPGPTGDFPAPPGDQAVAVRASRKLRSSSEV